MKYLVVTANFAPRSASPAVRTVHIVKYLAALGHEVKVLTYEESTLTLFSQEDNALDKKVPHSVDVVRIKGGPLRSFFFRRKRGNVEQAVAAKSTYKRNPLISLLVPDPHVESVYSFVRSALNIIQSYEPDVLITHGYPFSMHWVGSILKKKVPKIFWVADYGDPWVAAPVSELPRPKWRDFLDYRLERKWLGAVDLISVTTKPTLDLYVKHFPYLKDKGVIVPMGFDPDDFHFVDAINRPSNLLGKCMFVHTGRVYPQARDPRPFVVAVEKLVKESPNLAEGLAVVLVGELDNYLKEIVDKSPAKSVFTFIPWVPVQESIAWMKAADWLLLFGNKGAIQIPGKVYQYVGCGKPIFMTKLNEEDPTSSIVNDVSGSLIVDSDSDAIFRQFKVVLESFGTKKETLRVNRLGDEFSWPSIVKRLAEAVKK